ASDMHVGELLHLDRRRGERSVLAHQLSATPDPQFERSDRRNDALCSNDFLCGLNRLLQLHHTETIARQAGWRFCHARPLRATTKIRNHASSSATVGRAPMQSEFFLTLMASLMGLLYTALWLLIAYGVVIMIFRHAFGIELPNPFELLPIEWRQKLPYVLHEVK